MNLPPWLWPLLGYLCGSIPFGLVIGLCKGVDIRLEGSKNIGATNCGRVLGRRWGVLCFVLDLLKGLLPVLGAGLAMGWVRTMPSGGQMWLWLSVAGAAVAGHVLPVWLRFKGGKGVATGLGAVLGVFPYLTGPGVAAALSWVVVLKQTRYVSLASVMGALLLPVYLLGTGMWMGWPMGSLAPGLVVSGLMAVVIVVRHRANLARLAAGTEPKVGRKKDPSGPQ